MESKSDFDDSKTVMLSLFSDNKFKNSYKSEYGMLVIRCQEGRLESYMRLNMSPDYESGSYGSATVRLRYGDKPAFQVRLNESTDGEALFFNNPSNVIRDLLDVDIFLFGFTPAISNPTSATFDVRGLQYALPNVTDLCPLQ